MSGAIHPLPQYAFMAWCLVKAQGQLYFNVTKIRTKEITQINDPSAIIYRRSAAY
jgi:hypothetical protein